MRGAQPPRPCAGNPLHHVPKNRPQTPCRPVLPSLQQPHEKQPKLQPYGVLTIHSQSTILREQCIHVLHDQPVALAIA